MIGFRLRLLAVLTAVLSIGMTVHAPPGRGGRAACYWCAGRHFMGSANRGGPL